MRTLWILIALAGCAHTAAVDCGDGRTCPASTVCDEIHALCVPPAALTACAGLADGAPCSVTSLDGNCRDDVCITAVCGDGIASETEQCDGADLKGIDDCLKA